MKFQNKQTFRDKSAILIANEIILNDIYFEQSIQ